MLYRSILDFFRQWLRLELPETLPSMQPNCACTFLPLVLTSTFNNEANDTAIVSIKDELFRSQNPSYRQLKTIDNLLQHQLIKQ